MLNTLSGKALTVLGADDAETMGVTLPHEHLLIEWIGPDITATYPATGSWRVHGA